jgi:hypothetical protein
MIRSFLIVNALLYLFLGVWCIVDPVQTSTWVGLKWINDAGYSEWLTVYGGLELGLGLFFGWAALKRERFSGGVAFGFFLYLGLASMRLLSATLVDLGNAGNTLVVEILMVSWAALAVYLLNKSQAKS